MREVVLLVMTDGRRHVEETLPRALSMLHGAHIASIVIHDDSGDPEYRGWLQGATEGLGAIYVFTPQRLGFSGSYAHAWSYLAATSGPEWVFLLEDDFLFKKPVDLAAMMSVMSDYPYLAQLVLKRQPWNPEEKSAGGIVESHPEDFTEQTNDRWVWTGHRSFFSTNPCLFRRSLCLGGWPDCPDSEGIFTHRLLRDPEIRFAFWGGKFDPPLVEHIGSERVGCGY